MPSHYQGEYTDLDEAGVIFGLDRRYDPSTGTWQGNPDVPKDAVVKRSGRDFVDTVKCTYRVLLTRGMKGCYVYFQDKSTRDLFPSRFDTA